MEKKGAKNGGLIVVMLIEKDGWEGNIHKVWFKPVV